MSKDQLPTVFLSHGSPTTPLENIPAKDFWMELGRTYRGVKAVLCVSAHWETTSPAVNAADELDTIHDFYGFPQELYDVRYPARGSSELASRVVSLLKKAKIDCDVDQRRGLDHGAWVPLMVMFPEANIPVVQLSIQHHLDPAKHYSLGLAIAALRKEGVLVIGSGGAVHPLGYIQLLSPDAPTDKWAMDFDAWLSAAVERGDRDALTNYRTVAPYPERAHPRPDHYMPLLTAFGAAGPDAKGKVIHHSWYWGDLGMDAHEFT